jgi:hypothetical protein
LQRAGSCIPFLRRRSRLSSLRQSPVVPERARMGANCEASLHAVGPSCLRGVCYRLTLRLTTFLFSHLSLSYMDSYRETGDTRCGCP